MTNVAVLMSTYNGEKYLREQIDSIMSQSGVQVELFVRDDGSSDGTKAILTEYSEKNSNIHIEFAENVGVGNSFMNLLYSAPDTFDYYSLADQDDMWEKNKLIEAVKLLGDKLLYASNQECVDKFGNSLGLRYSKDTFIHLTPVSILECNMIAGCTMVLSNKFFKLLTEQKNRPSAALLKNRIHDVWLAMVASLSDGIVYDTRSFIKYRQHENNVVGAKSSFSKRVKERVKKLHHSEYRNGRSLLAKEIVERFPEAAEKYPLIEACSKAKSFKGKNKILKNGKELRKYTKESRLGFFIKVMFGLF
ncbi:MAG: glycosyltransferase [Oscillospiraceae bacterium]|nr:glycosyltransferase [Oscillospiraceae bacterium]